MQLQTIGVYIYSPDSPHTRTVTQLHVQLFSSPCYGGNCDLTFLLVIPWLFRRILSSARNSGVLLMQCMIMIVSVCLSLS